MFNNQNNSTPLQYRASLIASPLIEEFKDKLITLKLFKLLALYENLLTNSDIEILPHPIKLLDFEMLEAELVNQGILPKTNETLSQSIAREVSHLKWTASNYRKENTEFTLLVDVPTYVIKKAIQNLELIDNNGFSLDFLSNKEITYLEQFAAYLNGEYESASNTYEKGLNLILRTIKSSGLIVDHNEDNSKSINIILPIDKKNFMQRISSLNNTN